MSNGHDLFSLIVPPSRDLHVTVIVSRDDATGLPVDYVRDRVSFTDDAAAADYVARLRAWVAERPLVEKLGPFHPWPLVRPEPFDVSKLDAILSLERWPA